MQIVHGAHRRVVKTAGFYEAEQIQLIAAFTKKEDATKMCRTWSPNEIPLISDIKLYDNIEEFLEIERDNKRQKALAKLNDEDRKELGLND